MNDSLLVRGIEGIGDLDSEIEQLIPSLTVSSRCDA